MILLRPNRSGVYTYFLSFFSKYQPLPNYFWDFCSFRLDCISLLVGGQPRRGNFVRNIPRGYGRLDIALNGNRNQVIHFRYQAVSCKARSRGPIIFSVLPISLKPWCSRYRKQPGAPLRSYTWLALSLSKISGEFAVLFSSLQPDSPSLLCSPRFYFSRTRGFIVHCLRGDFAQGWKVFRFLVPRHGHETRRVLGN